MGVKFDDKNGFWTAQFSKRHPITRKPVTLRKRYKSKAEANRGYSQLVVAVEDKLRSSISPTWERLYLEWRSACRKGDIFVQKLSKGVQDEYCEIVEKYTHDWMTKYVEDISKADAWSLLSRVESEVSKSRAKKVRTAITGIFEWGLLSGRLPKVLSIPTEGFKWSKSDVERLPEILTRDQICQFLKYARRLNHPWYPIWALALYTGMRSGELYALSWDHIDFENQSIHVHRNWTNKTGYGDTKARYWRTVPIDSGEVLALIKELKLRAKDPYVLPKFKSWTDGRQAEILREFLANCGLPSIRFHALRACFATQLLRDGVAPAVVMKIAGWRDLKTMQRYVRLSGVEVKGATVSLKFLNEQETMGRIVQLFQEE